MKLFVDPNEQLVLIGKKEKSEVTIVNDDGRIICLFVLLVGRSGLYIGVFQIMMNRIFLVSRYKITIKPRLEPVTKCGGPYLPSKSRFSQFYQITVCKL